MDGAGLRLGDRDGVFGSKRDTLDIARILKIEFHFIFQVKALAYRFFAIGAKRVWLKLFTDTFDVTVAVRDRV